MSSIKIITTLHELPRSYDPLCEGSQVRISHHDVRRIIDTKHLPHRTCDPPCLPSRPEPEVVWVSAVIFAVLNRPISVLRGARNQRWVPIETERDDVCKCRMYGIKVDFFWAIHWDTD